MWGWLWRLRGMWWLRIIILIRYVFMKKIALVENEEKYRNILREELSSQKEWELSFYNSAEEFWRENVNQTNKKQI